MADFSFVHAADLHLDAPFKGIGRAEPLIARALRDASLEAFDRLVQLCLDREAAFLVIAGDLYDGPNHGLRAQLRLRDGLVKLANAGIWTFIVHGNHDPLEQGWSAVRESWPERAVVFPAGEVGTHTVTRDGETLAVVHGISYWRRDVTENLALRFRRSSPRGLEVGVLHCNVGTATGHAEYSPCTVEDLTSIGMDYWALGHVHKRSILSGASHGAEPWIVYPGNLQSRSTKPSELGAKGASVVEVRAGRIAAVEHVDCDSVRFEGVEVDVAQLANASITAVREALEAAAWDVVQAASGRSLVLRGRLVGRSELSAALKRPGARDELLETLRDGSDERHAAPGFVWWDSLSDETTPAIDLQALSEGGDFVADVVSASERLAARLGSPSRGADDASVPGALVAALTDGLPAQLRRRALELLGEEAFLSGNVVREATEIALDGLGVGLEEIGA